MKIALCVSGQPRFYKKGFEQLSKNVIIPNNCDVFLHCWYSEKDVGRYMVGGPWNDCNNQDIYTKEIPGNLISLYQPKKHSLEENFFLDRSLDEKWKTYPLTNGSNLSQSLHSMFYSVKKSIKLCEEYEKENNFKYDVIIRTRFDMGILDRLDICESAFTSSKTLYYLDLCNNKFVISDLLFWGSGQVIKDVCDVYDNIDAHIFDDECQLSGEGLFTYRAERSKYRGQPIPRSGFLIRDNDFSYPNAYGALH